MVEANIHTPPPATRARENLDVTAAVLGFGIEAERRARGLTQQQLAEIVGTTAPVVSRWETGTTTPHACHLLRLQHWYVAELEVAA